MPKKSALHRAIKNNQAQQVIKLLQKPQYLALIEQMNHEGLTLLQQAAARGMSEVVLWLIAFGADIDNHQRFNQTCVTESITHKPPLYLALEKGHFITAQILLCLDAERTESMTIALLTKNITLQSMLTKAFLHPSILQGIFIWTVSHQPPRAAELLTLVNQHINHDYLPVSTQKTLPFLFRGYSLSRPCYTTSRVGAKIERGELASLLAGLSALAQKNGHDDLASRLSRMNLGVMLVANPRSHFSFAQEQLYVRLKAPGVDLEVSKYAKLSDCLTVVDYLISQHDFVAMTFFFHSPGIDTLFTHAIDTNNQALLVILMFTHEYFTQTLKVKIPREITTSLSRLNNALMALGEKSLQAPTLVSLLTGATVGPTQEIYDYLDNTSQLQFFKITKTCQQFQKTLPCWPNAINHFLLNLQQDLKNQPYFNSREFRYLIPSALIIVSLLTMLAALFFLSKLIIDINAITSSMRDTTDNANSTRACADYIINTLFPPTCQSLDASVWDDCTDSCLQLKNQYSVFYILLVVCELIPAITLLAMLIPPCLCNTLSITSLTKFFFVGIERFNNESLYKFPIICQHTKNLETTLNEKYCLGIILFQSNTIEEIRMTIAGLKPFFQTEQRQSYFFKPFPALKEIDPVTIEVLDEPDTESNRLCHHAFRV